METVQLPAVFPAGCRRVHLAQFENVANGCALRDALVAASRTEDGSVERARMDYAFVDTRYVVSRRQLLTAVVQAIAAAERRAMRGDNPDAPVGYKTPTIHSEILWTLNPNNNVCV